MSIPCTSHGWFITRTGLLFLAMVHANLQLVGADYFIRNDGDDAAAGVGIQNAWRTIGRVNQARLQPGDRVLFKADQSFSGNLRLTAEDAGTSNAPVVIGSFGNGRARIVAGAGTGVTVENAGGIVLENLNLTGAGGTNNSGYGVLCDNTLSGFQTLDHLRIENVEVSGFGIFGILVGGKEGGFRHVGILNCTMRDNLRGGMEVAGRLPYDVPRYAHADVVVSHCRAFDNTGDPEYFKSHSGSGIVLYQVDGGRIEHCSTWNNGRLCHSHTGGGVGLWTCASRRVVIEHCQSFANRTSAADGGGFDIDGGCEECVLQYNYSHDNDGPGLMVYTYPYESRPHRKNIVRFNISENDARRGKRYAGLWVRNDGDGMTGVEVYNNTVIIGPWSGQTAFVHGGGVEAQFRNNVFVATGGALPLRVEQPGGNVRFENNLYWRDGAPFEVAWDEKQFSSMEDWRKQTGQEQVRGQPVGLFRDPRLSAHIPEERDGERVNLSVLSAFRPLPDSPALMGGLDLRSGFALEIGPHDFLGRPFSKRGGLPLGAVSGQAAE